MFSSFLFMRFYAFTAKCKPAFFKIAAFASKSLPALLPAPQLPRHRRIAPNRFFFYGLGVVGVKVFSRLTQVALFILGYRDGHCRAA